MKEGEKNTDKTLKEILNENNFPYIKDYKVFRTLGLKLLDRCVLSEILSYNIKGMEYAGSFEYICKEFNVTSKTALKALNNLIKAGYITKTASKGRKTSVYSINEDVLKQIFLNSSKSEQLNNPNYGKIPQLNNPNYGEIPQLNTSTMEKFHSKQCKNSTVNYGKIPHNNKYNNNNNNSSSSIEATATGFEEKEKHTPSNELKDVCQMYQREITQKISCSPFEIERLQKLISVYNADKVKNAIEIAVMRNKKSLSYIEGVLKTPDKQIAGTAPPQSETTAPKEPYYQPPNLSEY